MRKVIVICLALLMFNFAFTSHAQENSGVDGWNGARWGMNENEIREVFGEQIIKTQRDYIEKGKFYRELNIPKYTINGVEFKVLFEMSSGDDKLRAVRLIHSPAIASQFSEFEQLLVAKYGQPSQANESKTRDENRRISAWLLPKTKIELLHLVVPRFFYVLSIIYADRSSLKESLDKL